MKYELKIAHRKYEFGVPTFHIIYVLHKEESFQP